MNPDFAFNFYDVSPLTPWLESGVPILTPNFRLAREIKRGWGQHLQGQGTTAWETPVVLALEQWWQHCRTRIDPWNETLPRLATDQQELALWRRCVQSNDASSAFLRPAEAARQARDAYRNLLLWQLDWRRDPVHSNLALSVDNALFCEWAAEFERLCEDLSLQLLPSLVDTLAQRAPVDELALVECGELPPLYREALAVQAGTIHTHAPRDAAAAVSLVACEDRERELHRAARWAQQLVAERPEATVAILLPDLNSARYQFERILGEQFEPEKTGGTATAELPVNFSGGLALASTGSVRAALDLLQLLEPEVEMELVQRVLHSRYRQAEESAESSVLQKLYARGRAHLSGASLRYFARELELGRQLLQLYGERQLRQRLTASQWVEHILAALQTLGWPGEQTLDSHEYQQVQQFQLCLAQLAELDQVLGPINFHTARILLAQHCQETPFQVQTTPARIQVLGLLEGAGLQFTHIWLIGMNAGDWPAPARPNPFLPFALQRQHGLPRADHRREQEYAEQLLQQYRSACSELIASYAQTRDEVTQQASAMVRDFTAAEFADIDLLAHWAALRGEEMQQLEPESHAPALEAEEREQLRGGSGLIEDQSQCGFRAFAHHRLRVRSLPELAVGLTAADRGSLLHDALYLLWGSLQNSQRLNELDREELRRETEVAAASALGDFISRHPDIAGKAYLQLEEQHLAGLLLAWLAVEAQRAQFTVRERESESEIVLESLRLKLRIDRIDELAGGDLLVVDYKSGKTNTSHWLGQRPQQPQLPLYGAALGDTVAGLAFAQVRSSELAWRGLARCQIAEGIVTDIGKATARQEQPLADWESLRESWRQTLQALARQFAEGEARVDPADPASNCRYCRLQALCRVGEVGDGGQR